MQAGRTSADVIRVRIFLEGVILPYVSSIQVMNSPTSTRCSISLPSSNTLKPEQMVGAKLHIFWSDQVIRNKRGQREWPLLFQGQLSAEQKNQTISSTQTTLTFMGHSKYYDQAKLYFYDPNTQMSVTDTAGANAMAVYMGSTRINIDVAGPLSKQSNLLATLDARIGQMSDDPGRSIAFVSVLLEILRSAEQYHPYLRYITAKLKLSKRFAAFADPDVGKVLKLQGLRKIVEDRSGALGPNASIMDVLNLTSSMMRYDWLHIPDPILRPVQGENTDEAQRSVDRFEAATAFSTELADLIATGSKGKVKTSLGQVIIPAELAAVRIAPSAFVNNMLRGANDSTDLAAVASSLLKKGLAPRSSLPDDRSLANKAKGVAVNFGSKLSEKFEEDQGKKKSTSDVLEADQRYLMERDELNEFIATPNMEFAQPPACNIVFPTNMNSYGIMRDFDREVTRLIGKAQFTVGKDRVEEWYVAPQAQSFFLMTGANLTRFDATLADFSVEAPGKFILEEPDQ